MNKINNKYDNNYNNELKRQSLILDQGETDDTKKKSKQLESYLTQITKLIKEKEEKQAQVQQKVDEKKETNNIGALLLGTKREKARFTVAQTTPNGN
jgi:phosphotransacetylase